MSIYSSDKLVIANPRLTVGVVDAIIQYAYGALIEGKSFTNGSLIAQSLSQFIAGSASSMVYVDILALGRANNFVVQPLIGGAVNALVGGGLLKGWAHESMSKGFIKGLIINELAQGGIYAVDYANGTGVTGIPPKNKWYFF